MPRAVGPTDDTLAPRMGELVVAAAGTVRELLDRCLAGDPIRPQLQAIQLTMQQLATLTGQLNHTSRRRLPATSIDVNSVVQQLEPSLQRLLGPFISLNTSLDPSGIRVAADRSQLEQVLLALVINGREALPLGGVISVATRPLTVAATLRFRVGQLAAGDWVLLEVRDHGGVVDDVSLRQLIEPSLRTRPFDSSLSLSTMSAIVRELGGQVVFDTTRDDGTMLAAAFPASPRARRLPLDDGGTVAVLVADDDEWSRLSVTRVLRRAGWGVLEAEHATRALDLLDDVAGSCVRLVLVGARMRCADGGLLVERVRRARPDLALLIIDDADTGALPAAPNRLNRPVQADLVLRLVGQHLPVPE